MSNEYTTEIERFIERSMEHLERKRKDGMHIKIESTNNKTGQRWKTVIIIEKIEEDEH